jgi:hypothetical protein
VGLCHADPGEAGLCPQAEPQRSVDAPVRRFQGSGRLEPYAVNGRQVQVHRGHQAGGTGLQRRRPGPPQAVEPERDQKLHGRDLVQCAGPPQP